MAIKPGLDESAFKAIVEESLAAAGEAITELVERNILTSGNLWQVLRQKEAVAATIKREVVNTLAHAGRRTDHVCLVSHGHEICLAATDGTDNFTQSEDSLTVYIPPILEDVGWSERSEETAETKIAVFEMIKSGSATDALFGLSQSPHRIAFTQAQIKVFLRNHLGWLRIGGAGTFFICRQNDKVFLVEVYVRKGGLEVRIDRATEGPHLSSVDRPRFVTPLLAAKI